MQKIERPRDMLKVYSTKKHLSKLYVCYDPRFEYVIYIYLSPYKTMCVYVHVCVC